VAAFARLMADSDPGARECRMGLTRLVDPPCLDRRRRVPPHPDEDDGEARRVFATLVTHYWATTDSSARRS